MYIFFQIGDTTLETTKKAKELDSEAQTLFGRAKTVSTQNTANELNLEKAESQAAQANTSATQATKVWSQPVAFLIKPYLFRMLDS